MYGKNTYRCNVGIFWKHPETEFIVGKFCSLDENLKIYLGGNHRLDWVTTFPFGHIYKNVFNNFDGVGHPATKGSVIIENDVWVARDVTIMSGVTVGSGAVILNGSHVVKNVEPYSIVEGNPAKLVSYRFTEDQIKDLLEIKWWDWSDEEINRNSYFFNLPIDEFINFCKNK